MKRQLQLLLCLLLLPVTLQAQTKELDKLLENADKAYRRHETVTADSLYAQWVSMFKEQGATKDFAYTQVLNYLVKREVSKGHIKEAVALQEEIIEVRKTAPDCTPAQWASAMSDLSTIYGQSGDYDKAIATGEQALEMYHKEFGVKHNFYNIALNNIASYFAYRGNEGDLARAVHMGEQVLKYIKKGTPEYANCLNSLVVYYSMNGQNAKATEMSELALKEARKRLQADGGQYATVLNNLAIRLFKAGNSAEAIKYADEALVGYENAGMDNTLAYSKALTNAATFHTHIDDNKTAATMLEKALPIIEHFVGKAHPDYVRCMNDLSAVYKNTGNLTKADELANESDVIGEQLSVSQNQKYAKSLSKQASIFASNGNYTRAIEHERKALDIFQRRKDTLNIAASMGSIATYTFNSGRQEEALAIAEEAIALFKGQQQQGASFAQVLNNTSTLYYHAKDYIRAIDYAMQAADIYERRKDTLSTIYAKILTNVGLYNFMSDATKLAIDYTQRAIGIEQKLLGEEHPDNVTLLYNLAVYQSKDGNLSQATKNYSRAIDMQSDIVRNNFLHLTSNEREHYWNQKQYIFKYAPTLAYMDRSNEQMATDAYNSQLFMKGILLNSDIDFREILRRSGDTDMQKKFNQLTALYEQKDAQYKLPVEERTEDMDKLNRNIYSLERELVRGCKEYGNFTDNLNIGMAEVANALGDNEAAIEFAEVEVLGTGRTYIALLLRKGWSSPRLIRLFSDADIEDIKFNALPLRSALSNRLCVNAVYNSVEFGSLFWKPLMEQLDGIDKIYFSPSGMLYQLGIEYLYCDENSRIGEHYNLYRLSSTKSLAQPQEKNAITRATVYGGLTYDMTLAELQEQHENAKNANYDLSYADYEELEDEFFFDDDTRALDSLSTRGSVGYLEGTLHEAEAIGEQLMMSGVDTRMLLRGQGVEETFKALSGSGQQLIHIATHGFYIPEDEIKKNRQQLAFAISDDESDTENSLNFSGLLLAGANYTLTGNRTPRDLDDGVLTAKEIAKVNLSDADLVVLSACQTGLGEIKDDGVFGIQRGFKKAGAKSLLMSLWSVSDQATRLMMSTFYANLMSGQTKHEAFLNAQKTLREYPENDYSSPYFWASFILLDTLE